MRGQWQKEREERRKKEEMAKAVRRKEWEWREAREKVREAEWTVVSLEADVSCSFLQLSRPSSAGSFPLFPSSVTDTHTLQSSRAGAASHNGSSL